MGAGISINRPHASQCVDIINLLDIGWYGGVFEPEQVAVDTAAHGESSRTASDALKRACSTHLRPVGDASCQVGPSAILQQSNMTPT